MNNPLQELIERFEQISRQSAVNNDLLTANNFLCAIELVKQFAAEHDVIVPKFKVGQKVFYVSEFDDGVHQIYFDIEYGYADTIGIDNRTIWYNCRYESGLTFSHSHNRLDDIFLTESEAIAECDRRNKKE
jgi:hypothetical protein